MYPDAFIILRACVLFNMIYKIPYHVQLPLVSASGSPRGLFQQYYTPAEAVCQAMIADYLNIVLNMRNDYNILH